MSFVKDHVGDKNIKIYSDKVREASNISTDDFIRFNVKRGLRNSDGTGVMAGITKVCSVEGYYIDDGEKIPKEGRLNYRGINMEDIVNACIAEDRFGFEEVVFLLLFGELPNTEELAYFSKIISKCRELPEDFIEDMIMKAPSANVMNKMARCVLALYSFDEDPDNLALENVLNQSVHLIAQLPVIMAYAYQVKRRHFYKKSMYIHPLKPELSTAETILRSIRPDKSFTDEEAKLLDVCLMVHAEHGGGNNSTFTNRVLTSSGTDTYSAMAASIGALKGPKHGGANMKVAEMIDYFKENVPDITNEAQVKDYLVKIINKQAADQSGLIYGMGHAVYTISDPRAKILRSKASEFALDSEFEDEFRLLNLIEELTPQVFAQCKGSNKDMCANVDLYSGLVYKILGVPQDLFTPLFTIARSAGWSAHRIEELLTGNRIIRPAYKNISDKVPYVPLSYRD